LRDRWKNFRDRNGFSKHFKNNVLIDYGPYNAARVLNLWCTWWRTTPW